MQSQKDKKRKLQDVRILRQEYRDLTFNTEVEADYLANSSTTHILERLNKADKLFTQVASTEEAVLDAQFMRKTMDIAVLKAQSLKVGDNTFDLHDFIKRVGTKIKKLNDYEWNELSEHTNKVCLLAPKFVFLNGALEVEAKEKTVRRVGPRLVKDTNLDVTQLDKNVNETNSNVQMLHQLLEQHEPIGFFNFLVNPKSFSQTIENLFYFAFLTRDGLVSIEEDEEGYLKIATCEPPSIEDQQTTDCSKFQNVLKMDNEQWLSIIETFEITDSIIPHRIPTDVGSLRWQ